MRNWSSIKKQLPRNYNVLVSQSLNKQGFEVTASYVSDVRRGKIKNIDIQKAVWKEIKKILISQQRKLRQLKQLQR